MDSDKEIFKGKKLSDLFEEIYSNSKETKSQVKGLIGELKPLIENIGDATLLVPIEHPVTTKKYDSTYYKKTREVKIQT